ncbi:hypothetical protein [Spiroplasma turonicum]|uniref:Uncharacterized protein n=1 Tax=Spiroplasma turonicum TaxID=216946 RepID=A0A0K1P6P4_9MOLU|nr:hypothetical protein [Spiroplasma turonicum]AKU79955.1 hypothetical protein STURON_00709 [Spiroplasma turonicum]ALX70968.1 hypothetical protein STURO_v1c07090 [Spiroplasma turonicum]
MFINKYFIWERVKNEKNIDSLTSILLISTPTGVLACGNIDEIKTSNEEYENSPKELTYLDNQSDTTLLNDIKNSDNKVNDFRLMDGKNKETIQIDSSKNLLLKDYIETRKYINSQWDSKEIGDDFFIEGELFYNINYIKAYFKETLNLPNGYSYENMDFEGIITVSLYGKKGENNFTLNVYYINFSSVNNFKVHNIFYKNISLV